MEAITLKSKKQISKGKLKKVMKMKNLICRPDPTFWPQTSDEEGKTLMEVLSRLIVDVPEFKKPHWSELKLIPKELRPKPPPIPKVEGLMFGMTDCQTAIETKECIGVLIESAVNPKTIVQTLIETCTENSVPVLCLKELRRIAKINFGIPTSVLGVKQNCLPELQDKIRNISNNHKPPKTQTEVNIADVNPSTNDKDKLMDIEYKYICPYVYRTDKKSRVFTPSCVEGATTSNSNKFVGQNFIKLSNSLQNEKVDRKQYMKMIVKKISSNQNRKKITKGCSKDSIHI